MNAANTRYIRNLSAVAVGLIAGIAGTVAAYSLRISRPTPVAAPSLSPMTVQIDDVPERQSVTPHSVTSDSEIQLAAALARIDELYAERERDWQQTAAWVETLIDNRKPESSTRALALDRVRQRLRIRKQAESGQFLAQLDDDLMLLFATLLAGDEAIADLCSVVEDSSVDPQMRKEAFESLGYLPSEQSLALILNPPADLAEMENFGLDNQMNRLALLTDFLPPEVVAPHSEQLFNLAAYALNESADDANAWKLIASLAWEHNNSAAIKMLNNPRNTRLFGEDLLMVAWWSGTDASRDYVNRMGRIHPAPEIRQKAAEILAGWPEN